MKQENILVRFEEEGLGTTYLNCDDDLTITMRAEFSEIVLGPRERFHTPYVPPHEHRFVCECGEVHEDE